MVFRDSQFVAILNEVRSGEMTAKSIESLKQCRLTNLASDDGIEPTRLCMFSTTGGERGEKSEYLLTFYSDSRRKDVDEENLKFLRNLPGASVKFKAIDMGSQNYFLQQLQKNCPASEVNELKIGAQVSPPSPLSPFLSSC